MTPQEIIKKQAEAVTGFNKLTAAEHLEAAAKLLRQEAGQYSAIHGVAAFKAQIKETKERSITKAANGLRKMKEQQITDAFAGSDWVLMKEGNGVKTYCRKGKGHLYINVRGDQYSVTEGERTSHYTGVSGLGQFIAHEKKNRG